MAQQLVDRERATSRVQRLVANRLLLRCDDSDKVFHTAVAEGKLTNKRRSVNRSPECFRPAMRTAAQTAHSETWQPVWLHFLLSSDGQQFNQAAKDLIAIVSIEGQCQL